MLLFPYAVGLAALATVMAGALRRPVELAVAAATLLVGLALLAPRVLTGPSPSPPPKGERLTVAVANLRVGQADAASVVTLVDEYDVDVLVVLELTEPAITGLDAAGLDSLLPERELLPSRMTSGGGIYSRLPLTARPPDQSRGFGATPRATVELADGTAVALDPVHPLPPINARWADSWLQGSSTSWSDRCRAPTTRCWWWSCVSPAECENPGRKGPGLVLGGDQLTEE